MAFQLPLKILVAYILFLFDQAWCCKDNKALLWLSFQHLGIPSQGLEWCLEVLFCSIFLEATPYLPLHNTSTNMCMRFSISFNPKQFTVVNLSV